jgi:hypothetical protein
MAHIKKLLFGVFLAVSLYAAPRVEAGNYCAIFASSCDDFDAIDDVLIFSGCLESCESWSGCCAEYCSTLGPDKFVQTNECTQFCGSSLEPNCGHCSCQTVTR